MNIPIGVPAEQSDDIAAALSRVEFQLQIKRTSDYVSIPVRREDAILLSAKAEAFHHHLHHVRQFLKDIYATMIDPVEDNTRNVADTCALILKAAVDARQREADLRATWRCFQCGFETADEKLAAAHFGDGDGSEGRPLCLDWKDLDADGRASQMQSYLQELNGERDENAKLRQEIEGLEYQVSGISAAVSSRFKGCTTINEAWQKYDSMEGRALAAEWPLERLNTWLQTQVDPRSHVQIVLWAKSVTCHPVSLLLAGAHLEILQAETLLQAVQAALPEGVK